MQNASKLPEKFVKPEIFNTDSVQQQIGDLNAFPLLFENTVRNLTAAQRDAKTLPGVWTVAQVVNHIADSHMNAFIRVKLTLTEDNPTVKPYNESLWANLVDGSDTTFEHSLDIIRGVHKRFGLILGSLDEKSMNRTYYHPGYQTTYILWQVIALYAWHGKHHLRFITDLVNEKQW